MSARTYIYFIAPIGGGPIKIGCSACPPNRLDQLMAWSPYPLEILATAPGTMNDERAIHSAFLKHWAQREWFRSAPEIYALINEVRATGEIPAAFKGTKETKGLRRSSRTGGWTPEQRAKASVVHKQRWDGLRAGRAARPEIEAFLLKTGMTPTELGKAINQPWAISGILRDNPYAGKHAADAISYIRVHDGRQLLGASA